MLLYKIKNPIRDINELLDRINLKRSQIPYRIDYKSQFPFFTTLEFIEKIEKSNPYDPLLLQIIPRFVENNDDIFVMDDPLYETELLAGSNGILKKYNNRSLLIMTPNCASNCRFCFRRNIKLKVDYTLENLKEILNKNTSVEELILSGGDPLSLSNDSLSICLENIDKTDFIKRIRFHTRYPVFDSSRIDNNLIKTLLKTEKQVLIVFHINHPNEINDNFRYVIKNLVNSNIMLLNQSVILQGINDNYRTLSKLYKKLIKLNIIPYYQHQLDEVNGISHFNVSEQKIKSILAELKENLPGYMIPKFVKEIPNREYKIDINDK